MVIISTRAVEASIQAVSPALILSTVVVKGAVGAAGASSAKSGATARNKVAASGSRSDPNPCFMIRPFLFCDKQRNNRASRDRERAPDPPPPPQRQTAPGTERKG